MVLFSVVRETTFAVFALFGTLNLRIPNQSGGAYEVGLAGFLSP